MGPQETKGWWASKFSFTFPELHSGATLLNVMPHPKCQLIKSLYLLFNAAVSSCFLRDSFVNFDFMCFASNMSCNEEAWSFKGWLNTNNKIRIDIFFKYEIGWFRYWIIMFFSPLDSIISEYKLKSWLDFRFVNLCYSILNIPVQ